MSEAIVIGAGPAGSFCARLLKSRGWSVRLVEQHRFPRDKVCGECLSALGVQVLRQHGLLEPLLERGAKWLEGACVHAADGQPLNVRFSRPMLGVSRRLFDAFLLDGARTAGVEILQPARCERIEGGKVASVRVRELADNAVREWAASWVVLADGKSALLNGAPMPTSDLGIKAHWEEIVQPPNTIQLFGFTWGYGGFSPIEGDRWNMAFSVSAGRLREYRGDIDAMFDRMLEDQPGLRRKLSGAKRVTDWIASPLPRFAVRGNWPEGVIPIGNAAAAIEPIGGEGMGLALRSAELAAEAITGVNDRAQQMKRLRRSYKKLWRRRAGLCRAGAMVSKSRWLAPAVFEWLGANEGLSDAILRGIGK